MAGTRSVGLLGLCLLAVGVAVLAGRPDPVGAAPARQFKSYTETVSVYDGDRGEVVKASFDMIAVPGGTFEMGSPVAEKDRGPDEGPRVQVRVKPFWLGKCEVTWDEFDLYFKYGKPSRTADPSWTGTPADAVTKPSTPYLDETYGYDRNRHPAICMTHHAAMKYCEWLSKKTGKDHRLPTEAEWEYACRAGTTGAFGIPAGAKLEDYAWYKANSADARGRRSPQRVGTRDSNRFGLHDMHGNVMEWCLDHYVSNAYELFARKAGKDGLVLSPVFKPTEHKWSHVARGGHFKDDPKDLRSATRRKSEKKWMNADPEEPQGIWWLTNLPVIGFRVCRPLEPDELAGITSRVTKEHDTTFKP